LLAETERDQTKTGVLAFKLDNPTYHAERKWTKGDVFAHFDADAADASTQYFATYFVVKKTHRAVAMMCEWYETCVSNNYRIVDDSPSVAPNSPDFKESRHDQSIWSVLCKRVGVATRRTYPVADTDRYRHPIFDARNCHTSTLSMYPRRTVVQVWTQTFANIVRTADYGYLGLGDMIRGTMAVLALAQDRADLDVEVDLQHHPVSRWLAAPASPGARFGGYVKRFGAATRFVFGQELDAYLAAPEAEADAAPVSLITTNAQFDETRITPYLKAYMRLLFEPSKEMEAYMAAQGAPTPNTYNVVHCRVGDAGMAPADPADPRNLDEWMDWIKANAEPGDVVLSDSSRLKARVRAEMPGLRTTPAAPVHLGIETDAAAVRDTLADFFVAARAKRICTRSAYPWQSGFMYWAHKVYDVEWGVAREARAPTPADVMPPVHIMDMDFRFRPEVLTVYACPFAKVRVGKDYDGGYIIAVVPNVTYDVLIAGGIETDVSFEEHWLRLHPGAKCIAFDGTIAALPPTDAPITFVKKNIGAETTVEVTNLRAEMAPFERIFVKMDIEGGEIPWLSVLSDAQLAKMEQIVMEFHFPFSDKEQAVFELLNQSHYLVHFHGNNSIGTRDVDGVAVPCVFECTYVHKRHFKAPPALNREPIPGPLDMRNVPYHDELYLSHPPFCAT
jgi:hypothetical protein